MPHWLRTQMSPFDQMRLAKRVLDKDQHGGVCTGLSLLWVKEVIEHPNALSSERMAYLRARIQDASAIQKMRDQYADTYKQQIKANKEPVDLIMLCLQHGLSMYAGLPTNGWRSLGDEGSFNFFIDALKDCTPAHFLVSLWLGMSGLHMWGGKITGTSLYVFDPNFGEFWSNDAGAVFQELYDTYKIEDNLITNARMLLVRKK